MEDGIVLCRSEESRQRLTHQGVAADELLQCQFVAQRMYPDRVEPRGSVSLQDEHDGGGNHPNLKAVAEGSLCENVLHREIGYGSRTTAFSMSD
jgi:hypothetical protein